jgi:2-dehydropantoate 2-reductase
LSLGKIAIVGSGAVGAYYGGMLAHDGHDVHFLMRSDAATVRERGLTIKTGGKTIHFKANVHEDTTDIGSSDLVLIALKATANSALESLIPPLLGPNTALVTLQNGLGNEEYLAQRWGAGRVMGALCFVCLNRTAPGEITHFDHGSISIGEYQRPVSPRVQSLVDAFVHAGIDSKAVDALLTERWRKLVWNVPFNGLSIAANGATVADVLADVELRKLARDLMGEVIDAAGRLGHPITDDFADFQIERSYSMGPYKPSSMIDWEHGLPVEVDAIWGEPLRQGIKAGASLPRLTMLHALLRQINKPKSSRGFAPHNH